MNKCARRWVIFINVYRRHNCWLGRDLVHSFVGKIDSQYEIILHRICNTKKNKLSISMNSERETEREIWERQREIWERERDREQERERDDLPVEQLTPLTSSRYPNPHIHFLNVPFGRQICSQPPLFSSHGPMVILIDSFALTNEFFNK